MAEVLADGKLKFTILTTKPANPAAPTVTELNAGLKGEDHILTSDFTWSAADSDKANEKVLAAKGNAQALMASNFTGGVSVIRQFDDTTKNGDSTGDVVFAALKVKGSRVWCYGRETGKDATEVWAADDEIFLGGEVISDEPQRPADMGAYIKVRVPLEFQRAYPNIKAVAGGSSSSSSSSS